ncbi:hypothetical protein CFR75_16240 [Komagataeibacter xylinus]|uniref:Uncharacterized protein n=2 Tax=Komagataeibacter xylinus TaxID=28448 RepID=A0A318PHA7_KOMXY|nr:hypothetical protein CFR75_16240 [Komagataeibacter xylinus]
MVKNKRIEILFPLIIFSVLLCARFHSAMFHGGRFMAEEGCIFFEKAWNSSWSEALFFSYGGYLNIVANASTLLAYHFMPLADAPYLTMGIALLFQLCAPWLILTAKDAWLASYRVRLIAVTVLLVVPEWVEVSLHSVHSQYHLALCCGLILALDTEKGWREYLRCALLFCAPLSGPGGVVMAPLFILRAIADRTRVRMAECLVINVASAIQILLFFHKFQTRAYSVNCYDYVLVFLIRYVMTPLIGLKHTVIHIGQSLQTMEQEGNTPYPFVMVAVCLLGLCVGTLIYQMIFNKRSHEAVWLALAGGAHALVSMFGALGGAITLFPPYFAERYIFVGQSLFSLSIVCLAVTGTPVVKKICWYLVAIMVVMGIYHFITPFNKNMLHGPSWWVEVTRWEKNHDTALHIWPQPEWNMHLH